MTSKTNLEKEGAAQAALLGAMLGILGLSLVNFGTEISKGFENKIFSLGKLWMPGVAGIGPYSGKETVALAVWILSWWFLHRLLKKTELNSRIVIGLFLIGIACATTLLWPPVIDWVTHLATQH